MSEQQEAQDEPQEALSETHKKYLLVRARWAISNALFPGLPSPTVPKDLPEDLPMDASGLFIHLTRKGQHRGIMGSIDTDLTLLEAVDQFAVQAANSTKHPPLALAELPAIVIEISIVTSVEPICTTTPVHLLAAILPNTHGLVLNDKYHEANFTPQRWEEFKERQQFVDALLHEGGWNKDPWPMELNGLRYQTINFVESYKKPVRC